MKALCGNCGSRRKLRAVIVTWKGETKRLDMCKPCHSAVKEAIHFEQRAHAEQIEREYQNRAKADVDAAERQIANPLLVGQAA